MSEQLYSFEGQMRTLHEIEAIRAEREATPKKSRKVKVAVATEEGVTVSEEELTPEMEEDMKNAEEIDGADVDPAQNPAVAALTEKPKRTRKPRAAAAKKVTKKK